jgi:hypothetical protein
MKRILNHIKHFIYKRKELKRLQSKKCNIKKAPGKKSYESDLKKVLEEEEIMKQVRSLLDPKEKTVTTFEQEDVNLLDYDETIKAIKSIQSKKTHTRWLTAEEGNNDEYRNAVRIERMLIEHKNNIKPVDDNYIRKTDLMTIIDELEHHVELSHERIIEMLKELI